MSYQWDVFLSYRRSGDWPTFVARHFLPKFRHWLDEELGRGSDVFVDVNEVETGEAWPYRLADALACSRTMVCLWSRQYFSSKWCAGELAHMLARRKLLSPPPSIPLPLILAVVIHDMEKIPHNLAEIQQFSLHECSNPWIAKDSLTEEQLSKEIRKLAKHVAHAIDKAPEHDDAWLSLSIEEFVQIFSFDTNSAQTSLPSLG